MLLAPFEHDATQIWGRNTWLACATALNGSLAASCLFADRGSTTQRRAACHHQKVRSLPALRLVWYRALRDTVPVGSRSYPEGGGEFRRVE